MGHGAECAWQASWAASRFACLPASAGIKRIKSLPAHATLPKLTRNATKHMAIIVHLRCHPTFSLTLPLLPVLLKEPLLLPIIAGSSKLDPMAASPPSPPALMNACSGVSRFDSAVARLPLPPCVQAGAWKVDGCTCMRVGF